MNRLHKFMNAARALKAFAADILSYRPKDDNMLDWVQHYHFQYFKNNQDPDTGLILDNSGPNSPASIAAVGFALTAYPIAVKRGCISKKEAIAWTLKVLTNLWTVPQGDSPTGVNGFHGVFYHMLDPKTGMRAMAPQYWNSELSSIDTALLMAGVLFARNYYRGFSADEQQIRTLANNLWRRVEWDWMSEPSGLVKLAWTPENGFQNMTYQGMNEARLLYILGLASPTHPLPDTTWDTYIGHEPVSKYYGQRYLHMEGAPLFVYQYPESWIDFRGIRDDLNRRHDFDYFENSRRATIAQYRYALDNPQQFRGYNRLNWGLTACVGPFEGAKIVDVQRTHCESHLKPVSSSRTIDGVRRSFHQYTARGCPAGVDDGTIAPTAAISSLPFAPELVLPLLRHWYYERPELMNEDGFTDAFNPTFDSSKRCGWISPQRLGIDQGPIVLMVENYRSNFVWDIMLGDADLRKGLKRAGFTGGWLTH